MDKPLMASEWAVVKTVRLSRRFAVEMTAGPGGFTCEWSPDVPGPGSLSKAAWRRYVPARAALIEDVATRLGGRILILDMGNTVGASVVELW